jgi:DNA mismatch repair protein MutL
VAGVCLRAALAHPELALCLRRDQRVAQEYLRASNRLERVQAVFSGETLATYEGTVEGAEVFAALGAPEHARAGSTQLHLYVNQRPVRDTALARAVAYAYGSVLPPGRFPFGVVYLTLDPSEVDVNVHPQKLEVRFARGRALLDALTRFLAKSLGTSAWSGPSTRGAASYWSERLGGAGVPLSQFAGTGGEDPDPWQLGANASGSASGVAESVAALAGATAQDAAPAPLIGARGFFASLRPLGQAARMFVVCEGADALYVLDQHAADERVRFDRLRKAHAARDVKVQDLLFPERVECSELEAQAVEDHHDELARAGLPCTRLGPTTVAVTGMPALLRRASPARLLRDVLTELGRAGERAFSDAIDMALATMACHGAIRAGDALAPDEIAELLRSLDQVSDFQGHCPHGRPVACTLPFDDLERKLGR